MFKMPCFLLFCAGSAMTAGSVRADQMADTLLKGVVSKYKSMKTFSATVTTFMDTGDSKLRSSEALELQKPNLAYIVPGITTETGKNGVARAVPDPITVSNGKTLWTFNKAANTYSTSIVDSKGSFIALTSTTIGMFYFPEALSSIPEALLSEDMLAVMKPALSSRYIGVEKWDGMRCQVIESTLKLIMVKPGAAPTNFRTLRLYIGPDKLVHRVVQDSVLGPGITIHVEETVTNMRIDPNVPAADFNFTPQAGAKDTTPK